MGKDGLEVGERADGCRSSEDVKQEACKHRFEESLAGGEPTSRGTCWVRGHMLVRAKPEKEQERGKRAEKRAQREGEQ